MRKVQRLNIVARGYGHDLNKIELSIATNHNCVVFKLSPFPYFANFAHAVNELQFERPNFSYLRDIFQILKRFVSIGASRGNLFEGITNGYRLTCSISFLEDSKFLRLDSSDKNLVISRRIFQTGIIPDELSRELERAPRRFTSLERNFITSLSIRPKNKKKNEIFCVENLHKSKKAKRLQINPNAAFLNECFSYSENKSEYRFLDHHSNSVNRLFNLRQVIVTPHGALLDCDGVISRIQFQPIEEHLWPSTLWYNSEFQVEVERFESCKRVLGERNYILINTNWAHFVEDNVPAIMRLLDYAPYVPFVFRNINSQQLNFIHELFPDLVYEIAPKRQALFFENVNLHVHQDSRSQMIRGISTSQPMIDSEMLNRLRQIVFEKSKTLDISETPKRILITRTGNGFRRLINHAQTYALLQEFGFHPLDTSRLNFEERIRLFSQAEVVAGESGAGLVNLYFCHPSTSVIELRHPSLLESKEHIQAVELTQLRYSIFPGTFANTFQKIRFGSDAFTLNIERLRNFLEKSEIK